LIVPSNNYLFQPLQLVYSVLFKVDRISTSCQYFNEESRSDKYPEGDEDKKIIRDVRLIELVPTGPENTRMRGDIANATGKSITNAAVRNKTDAYHDSTEVLAGMSIFPSAAAYRTRTRLS